MKTYRIIDIGNTYGGFWVAEHEDKFYWGIEDYEDDFESDVFDKKRWDEIAEKLYRLILEEKYK